MNSVSVNNTSRYPTKLIQVLVRFAIDGRETGNIGLNFKNSRHAYRGRAYQRIPRISNWRGAGKDHLVVVAIGSPERFPLKNLSYRGKKTAPVYDLADWMEAAVHVIAHELTHCEQFRMKRRCSEIEAERSALRTLNRFRAARTELGVDKMMADAAAVDAAERSPEAVVARKKDKREKKLEAKRALLEKWQRKAKLAATKVKKLTRDVARLEKAAQKPIPEPKPRKPRETPVKRQRVEPELFSKLDVSEEVCPSVDETGSYKGLYTVEAPNGYRFVGLQSHVVCNVEARNEDNARRVVIKEHQIEACPDDCDCKQPQDDERSSQWASISTP